VSGPLAGYRIVDLSSGIAGAYATKLLADGGAAVAKVEAPAGDPLRRWSASGSAIPPGEDAALFRFLSGDRPSAVADPDDADAIAAVLERVGAADAVVWSPGSPLAEHPALSPAALRDAAPHATVTSITPFGLDGPWSDRPATELTLQAWSGAIVGLGRGAPDRAPVSVGGQIGQWMAGTYAAIGTLVSRTRALADGQGELVDVSILEVLALSLTYYPVTYADMAGRPFRKSRAVITPGVEATRDGLVGLGVGTGQQWLDFCALVGHPEWQEDRSLFANRTHLAPEIAAWMAEHTSAEVLDLASAFRIPHAPIGTGATIPVTDHFVARGAIVDHPGGGFVEPARPFRLTPAQTGEPGGVERPDGRQTPLGSQGEGSVGPERPFAGLRVLDLTAFWAGPLCTEILALLGAEVLHIESTARPDGTRLLAGLRFSEPDWWEQSGIFSGLNAGKQSITLDLQSDRGRELLRRLAATCDVVVENSTPRVLEQIGLTADVLHELRPDAVLVRMPGFGLDGPWRDNPAFAFVIEDAAGLTWRTGHPDTNPVSPYCVGDSNAGLHALTGLLLALEHRRRTGEGVVVEAAMVDAALNVAAEQIVEHSAFGALLGREGNRAPTGAPHNLYLAADVDHKDRRDTWVAIAVESDDQWRALRGALGTPDWSAGPELESAAGRRAAQDQLDEHLAAWCAERPADDVVEALWPAGVPVGKVVQPHEQGDLAQLQARGYFEAVDHPVTGSARHSTLPIRFSRGPERVHHGRAPLLGEHNHEALRGIGLSDDEIAALEAEGVIGRAPNAGH
jgi:crotonobetainyl-CoA:carnitine CoA-transferase CaiB-like acyl-CoA transferase